MDCFQAKAFPGRQGFCVRERSTPPRNEIAAAVTRSHPAGSPGTVKLEAVTCGYVLFARATAVIGDP